MSPLTVKKVAENTSGNYQDFSKQRTSIADGGNQHDRCYKPTEECEANSIRLASV